jgi:peptide/nickel transport system substrate-binding protein
MRRAQRREVGLIRRLTHRSRTRRRAVAGAASVLAIGVIAAGCGQPTTTHVGTTPVNGGTVTYALPANDTPSYIFPFAPGTVFTIVNLDNLQYFLYRPLYWWGDSGLPYLNEHLSLAYAPTYKGQVVTIRLKQNYKWSNGEQVTAQDVMFWMNLSRKLPTDYGGYVPGGMPDDISAVKTVGKFEVQITIKGKYSARWFTSNELSQITPLPMAWDVSGPNTKSNCAEVEADCPAVFKYLNGLSLNSSDWAASPIWGVVDGPWKLTSLSSTGTLTFKYNTKYSGPVGRHHISTFVEDPFTTEEAEFNVLQAGGAQGLDVGYLPTVDAPVPPPGRAVGENPVTGYKMQPVYTWGLSYIPYNFNPVDPAVHIFDQEYFRQAFQYLVNQASIIQGALHGYGKISTGPVGDTPVTKYLSGQAKQGDPFPYNLGRSEQLLSSHGWHVDAGGVTTCQDAALCGNGVKQGAKLSFTMYYATGSAWVEAAVLQLKSNASLVGIQINLIPNSFDQLIVRVENGCGTATKPAPCQWELADWGQGWSYVPDYLPTGDELFGTNSIGNIGEYSNPTNDALIRKTVQSSNLKVMYRWEKFLTPQLPVILQPEAPAALVESINTLRIGKQSPTLALTPEDWYYVK